MPYQSHGLCLKNFVTNLADGTQAAACKEWSLFLSPKSTINLTPKFLGN